MTAAPSLERWTAQVAELTRPYRERRADALANEGMRRQGNAHAIFLAGQAPARDPSLRTGKWHLQRARGHRERFERVAACEREFTLNVHCSYCGRTAERPTRCRTALVCMSCRGKIASEKVAKLTANRRRAIDQCARLGLFRRARKGGAWSEKLLTFTIPHFAELGVAGRVELLRATWRAFMRTSPKKKDGTFPVRSFGDWLRAHPDAGRFKDERAHPVCRWFRNVEWTTGEDEAPGEEKGHPHIHVWFLGPYLEGAKASEALEGRNVVRAFWAHALARAARDFPALCNLDGTLRADVAQRCARPIVDVRRCLPGPKSLREVIKYLFKDLGTHGRLAPALWAQVYEAFDGRRTTQGSRGLATLATHDTCYRVDLETGELIDSDAKPCACGQRGYWRVHRRAMTAEERAAALAAKQARGLVKTMPREKGETYVLPLDRVARP